jgi:hypothetical protein
MQSTQSMQSTSASASAVSITMQGVSDPNHHLYCTVCGTHFEFFQCVNWSDNPEHRCNQCSKDGHCCPNCLEFAARPCSIEEMRAEKLDRRKKMRDIPSRQCTTCSRRFSRNECTKADTCPTCLTPTAVHVSKGKLLDGETARDYICHYFQLLADKGLLRVIRIYEDGMAFHLVVTPLHDGTTFVIGTHLHERELDDERIMQRLFSRARKPNTSTIFLRVLVSIIVTDRVDVFKGLALTEENDDNHIPLHIDAADLWDNY